MTDNISDTPAITLRDAAFGYDGIARVTGLTLTIPRGATVALIGPNGSGKSTLLAGVLGIAEQLGGEAQVLGEAPGKARRRIGTQPQADTRDPTLPLTVRQVVTMGLYAKLGALKPLGKAGRQAVQHALERVGMGALAARQFGELSGGQQQRVIIARTLVSDPELLLFDEPFNGLDRTSRDSLLKLFAELRAEGRTVIVSTHDIEIAQQACTHALLLASGHAPGEVGHLAGFGELGTTLNLETVLHAFHDTSVEIDEHTIAVPGHEESGAWEC